MCLSTIFKIDFAAKYKLGAEYKKYLCYSRKITPETTSLMVNLRKQGNTISYIALKTKYSTNKVSEILKKELGDTYKEYNKNSVITEEIARILIEFKKKGKSYSEMSRKTKVSVQTIEKFFKKSSSQMVKMMIKKLNIEFSKQNLAQLIRIYQKIWEQIRVKFKQPELLLPVLIYVFSKIKGLNIDIKELKRRSGLTQNQFCNCLREVKNKKIALRQMNHLDK